MNKYSNITNAEFDAALVSLMENSSMETILMIPGVYEAVSEHFNNEALDVALEAKQRERREHLRAVIANIALYGFVCYQDAPFNGRTELLTQSELNSRRLNARRF